MKLALGSGGGSRPSRIFSCSSFQASRRFCLRSFFRSFFVRNTGIYTGFRGSAATTYTSCLMSTATENYLSKLERAFLFHKQHSVLQKITSPAMLSIVKCNTKGAYRSAKDTKRRNRKARLTGYIKFTWGEQRVKK